MSAPASTGHPLLVVIDPVARRTDGEAVRIAKDVLCAGATAKICLPDGPEEVARALSRRGSRRPVVVGDDAALLRIVGLLHRERVLGDAALALVPVGASPSSVALAGALGVPTGPVAAARAVLDGVDRELDLLVDDSDGVVLGGLTVPDPSLSPGRTTPRPWWEPGLRTCRSLVRTLAGQRTGAAGARAADDPDGAGGVDGRGGADGADSAHGADGSPDADGSRGTDGSHGTDRSRGADGSRGTDGLGGTGWILGTGRPTGTDTSGASLLAGVPPQPSPAGFPADAAAGHGLGDGGTHRLRVEADGVVLVDLDQPVAGVSVTTGGGRGGEADGLVQVVIRPATEDGPKPLTARARTVTISGPDFRYRADALLRGPVRTRTWTILPSAWRLTLPRG
ncbi:diacylglycerol kinase [Streptomyces sp. bgisy100]|uniref:diacylglycerol kinase n=1 Tax=Streptomyces sp. bgisy100 TaxID=3413783 RepID=UPI003D74F2C3